MVIAENGESESYGVEDGGLFVEMVVTSDFPKENQTIVRFGIILRKMDIYIYIYIYIIQRLRGMGLL